MKSMRKGFTLIELMIVIAIIAIIAAIAIPNLMQSRIRANEATAVTTIKQYATAQVTWQVGKQGRLRGTVAVSDTGDSGFADNFRNLYYAPPVGQSSPMALVSQAIADAFGAPKVTGAIDVITTSGVTPPTTPSAYQGYYLNEPQNLTNEFYEHNFAILASPAHTTNTGTNQYWVDQQGTVYMKGLAGGDTYDDIVDAITPSVGANDADDTDYTGWDVL